MCKEEEEEEEECEEGRKEGMEGVLRETEEKRRLRTSWRVSSGVRIWGSDCKLHVLTQQRTDFFQPLFSAFFHVTDPSPHHDPHPKPQKTKCTNNVQEQIQTTKSSNPIGLKNKSSSSTTHTTLSSEHEK